MCNTKGRSCIDQWSSESFNCSVACDGIFVDIEWEEDDVLTGKGGLANNNIGMNRKGKGDLLNRNMFASLVEEYIAFKRNHVKHFRYDVKAESANYGKILVSLLLSNNDSLNQELRYQLNQTSDFSGSTLTRQPLTTLSETRRSRWRLS